MAQTQRAESRWDTSDIAMAIRFGDRVCELIQHGREGQDVREVARLAFSYAFRVQPDLRFMVVR
jgi:hypothetical protein